MTIEKSALELVGDVYGLLEIDEFRPGLLAALRRAVPSAYATENPLLVAYERTKDGRPYRFSDVISVEDFHALDLYREFYAQIGLEHQIAFLLPGASGAIIGVALSRRDHDYTDAERDLLELARPHLIQAYANALRYSEALRAGADGDGVRSIARARLERLRELGLTAREGEALVLAAAGSSDREIAETLGLSPRTVAKHLQRSYVKLRIDGRAAATELVDDLDRAARRPT